MNDIPRTILSKANQALLIPRVPATENYFPAAQTMSLPDGDRLVVPHDLRTYKLLRAAGLPCPHPLLTYYDWRGGTPFDVQRATCAMLTGNPRAYVLNAMGTGKTKCALWAWDYLHGNKLAKRALVVAPLSTLHFTWVSEAFRTIPDVKVQVLHGSKKKRLERLADPDADIFVINHDGLATIAPELLNRLDIDTLILDELAVYRNNSDRSKLMRKFAARFEWVWGMTGSPMPNEPVDVWAQCQIITPWSVPKRITHCRDMLMIRSQHSQFVWLPKSDAVENAFKMMQPSVRFALDDVVELPEVVHTFVDVPLTPEQAKVYKEMATFFISKFQGGEIKAVNAAVVMGKLLQVAGGWVYTTQTGTVRLDNHPRLDALIDTITSCDQKVILLVPYRHAMDGISAFLESKGIEHAQVHGDVSQGERSKIFNLFQNTSKYKVLEAHPECLAHGLTLTAADTIIWWGPIASLEMYEQANARITRVGQVHKQRIVHLQSTPVEKRIYTLLRTKKKVQDSLLDMFEEASSGLLDAA